jgi:hypothetical protein
MIRKLITPNLREIKQRADKENKHKPPPPYKTHAENYYYIKQMNNRTQLVLELVSGDTLKGLLDWYDEKCLKIVFKTQIKYIFKNPDFAEQKREETEQAK